MDRPALIEAARATFQQRFGYPSHAVGVAPGRVELLGNHTDYNDGFVLTAAIDRAVAIAGAAREAPQARLLSAERGETAFDPSAPTHAPEAGWADYVKGVVQQLARAGAPVGGFDAAIVSSVPTAAGVSSSAALLVATVQLLLALYPHPIALDAMALARLCRAAENEFVGAPVGLLDQFSSIFGRAGHALFLDCRSLAWRAVALPAERARILVIDTGVQHAVREGEGGYVVRHAQCMEAARRLLGRDEARLRDVTPELLEEKQETLEPILQKRARHIVYENWRVHLAAEALEAGNLELLGEMMNNTHESCRTLFENSCPEIDCLVETAQAFPGVFGAKLSGAGWGGCAVAVHRPDVTEALCAELSDAFARQFGRAPALIPTAAAAGAEAVAAE